MRYTLDELVAAVADRLAAAGLDCQANGQVSAFPDRRTLRYYTTIGLMDRPDAVRDRQAIYGDRHVTQAVAVKRLQASGLALSAIQHRLAGLPPAEVEAVAAGYDGVGRASRTSAASWTSTPATAAAAPAPASATAPAPASMAGRAPRRFWADPTPAATIGAYRPMAVTDAQPMVAIALSPGATLLLATDRTLTPGEVTAIRAAASELLNHLPAAVRNGADVD